LKRPTIRAPQLWTSSKKRSTSLKAAHVKVLVIDEVSQSHVRPPPRTNCRIEHAQILEQRTQNVSGRFGVAEAREAIHGDVQLARRFDA
jgi:hypothetical protein